VGKKIPALIRKELGRFKERALERGVEKRAIEELANQIETFGRYGFNRAHSVAYSLLSYQTAWLKVHYPAEFVAALLSSVLDKTDDVVKYIAECRELPRHLPSLTEPIEVLPPDVNQSGWKFTAVDGRHIRFGLGAVRGVGAGAVRSVLEARREGPFTGLFDFLERVDVRTLNKRACEALIAAGALDAFGHRAQLLAGLDTAYQEVLARRAEEEAGQESLFGGEGASALARRHPALPDVPEWSEHDRLAREKAALGFFISGHPLDRFRDVVGAFEGVNTRTLSQRAGQSVELACVVTDVARQISKRDNSEWGRITVEDFHGTATILAFKETWQTFKSFLVADAVVLINGKVSGRERDEDDPPIFLDAVEPLEALGGSGRLALQIAFPTGTTLDPGAFRRAREVLSKHPGQAPVEVALGADNGSAAHRLRSRSLRVEPDSETISTLSEVFGAGRVRLVKIP
jgi:DNA polymerase-3 subunit alpha